MIRQEGMRTFTRAALEDILGPFVMLTGILPSDPILLAAQVAAESSGYWPPRRPYLPGYGPMGAAFTLPIPSCAARLGGWSVLLHATRPWPRPRCLAGKPSGRRSFRPSSGYLTALIHPFVSLTPTTSLGA
jgi:hypothetical protein